jgi:hypothetical protein
MSGAALCALEQLATQILERTDSIVAVAAFSSQPFRRTVECRDPVDRLRATQVRVDTGACRVSVALPPGEGATFTSANARCLATALLQAADALDPARRTR